MQVMDQHYLRVTERSFVLLLLASYLSRHLTPHTSRIADNNEPLIKEDRKEFMSIRGRMRTAEKEVGDMLVEEQLMGQNWVHVLGHVSSLGQQHLGAAITHIPSHNACAFRTPRRRRQNFDERH